MSRKRGRPTWLGGSGAILRAKPWSLKKTWTEVHSLEESRHLTLTRTSSSLRNESSSTTTTLPKRRDIWRMTSSDRAISGRPEMRIQAVSRTATA